MNTAKPTKWPALPSEWPVALLALPAFVAIWGGWVGLGELTGFGPVNLLPGIGDGWTLNTAITLPIGVEAYAAFALRVWLDKTTARTAAARRFAMWSAIGSLLLGAGGQVAYHLMTAWGVKVAPWQITTFVSCLPVVVLGCGAALVHLCHGAPSTASSAAVTEPPAPAAHTDPARRPQVPPRAGDEPHAVSPATPQNAAGETAPDRAGDPPVEPPAPPARTARPVLRPASPARPKRTARPATPPANSPARISDDQVIARLRAVRAETGDLPTETWMRDEFRIGQPRAARLRAEAARPDLHTVKDEEVAVG